MTTQGTCYFISMNAAKRYYRGYGFKAAEVEAKVERDEIKVGKPPIRPNERRSVIDGGTRWAVTTEGVTLAKAKGED